jgi:hypothetical protein
VKVTRVYSGDDGESHFEDLDVPLVDRGAIGAISALQPATGIVFRETSLPVHHPRLSGCRVRTTHHERSPAAASTPRPHFLFAVSRFRSGVFMH